MITIRLGEESERRLRELAERSGQDAETLACSVLELYLHDPWPFDTDEQWAEASVALTPELFAEEDWDPEEPGRGPG